MGLIFSDLHLDNYSQFSTITENGLNSRLFAQIKIVNGLRDNIMRQGISDVYFLGDLFNSLNESMPKIIYQVAFDLVKLLQEVCNLTMIVGNHDIYQRIHLFTPFKSLPNVRIIYKPTYITVASKRIAMFPWDTFKRPKKSYDLILGHFGIKGADIGSGVRNLDKEIPYEDLKDSALTIAGHYHTCQRVGIGVYHVGSIMAHRFSDPGNHGYFTIEKNSNGQDEPQAHYMSSPQFVRVLIRSEEDLKKFLDSRDYLNYYQLVLSEHFDTPEFDHKVMVTYNTDKDIADRSIELPKTKTFSESVAEFIDKSITSVDKDLAKKYIGEIIKEQMKGEEL